MSYTTAFKDIPDIRYEGPDSNNPFAYRWYQPSEVIAGRRMEDWLRLSVCYWHTFRGTGSDPFGGPTLFRPWEDGSDSLAMALKRVDVVFDFLVKLGVKWYCFHDRDVAPEGRNLTETNDNLWKVAKALKQRQDETGLGLLWGTANLFSHPRFAQGAATSPSAEVFAYAANSVKEMLEVTKFLGGVNYVFWGGREGYNSLLNTDMKRELDHLGRFLGLAVAHAKEIGFTGQFLIEPKPCEPTKHQYDFDAANCLAFLQGHGLADHFKFNIEANHATLARHDFCHELEWCRIHGKLGSVDANRGDLMLGWDTDQFPADVRECTQAMLIILQQGGLGAGGLNLDAKVRRDSIDIADLFHAHICGIDTWARALRLAERVGKDGRLATALQQRYASWDGPLGAGIESGKTSLRELQAHILKKGDAAPPASARQEYLENLFNGFC